MEIDKSMIDDLRSRYLLNKYFKFVVGSLVVVVLVSGWLTYAAYGQSNTVVERQTLTSAEWTADFNHYAMVKKTNPIFSRGERLSNRNVYFTSISPILRGKFVYNYTSGLDGSVTAEATLNLVTHSVDNNGRELWQTTEQISHKTRILSPGESFQIKFSQNMSRIQKRIKSIRKSLNSSAGEIGVVFVTDVDVNVDSNGGNASTKEYTYRMPVTLEDSVYRVSNSSPVTNTTTVTRNVKTNLQPGILQTVISPIILLASLSLIIGLVARRRQGYPELSDAELERMEFEDERDEFDDWITKAEIDADELSNDGSKDKIEVDSLEGLVDLAIDTDNRVIEDGEHFFVIGDSIYSYSPPELEDKDEDDGESRDGETNQEQMADDNND
ncbi:MAG: DUF5305 domain-containing protein [Halobacteria archaeon]|nr:DUF5305 domain-containing protein [Halobacteria archaeon]